MEQTLYERIRVFLRPLRPVRDFLDHIKRLLRFFFLSIKTPIRVGRSPLDDINLHDYRVYSQNGEDGILAAIFLKIGTTNKYFVEFGVGDGLESNSYLLSQFGGWKGLLMDSVGKESGPCIKEEFITAENINDLFRKYEVPDEFDLLSIDIDGNDYWVWKILNESYRPRVVIMEYNASVPPHESRTIEYKADFCFDGSTYFGASLLALANLGGLKDYSLVGCDRMGANAFFVRDDLIGDRFVLRNTETRYRQPKYGETGTGHPSSDQVMINPE